MIELIPGSYKELNFKKYIAIINKIPAEKPQDLTSLEWSRIVHMATLTVLTGLSEAEIEESRAVRIKAMINKLSFLDNKIEPGKTKYKIKSMDDLTYDEFSTYQSLRNDQWANMHEILGLVIKNATPEEIDNMSTYDAVQVFFCLNRSMQRFLKRMKYWETLRLIWLVTKKAPAMFLKRIRSSSKDSSRLGGAG